MSGKTGGHEACGKLLHLGPVGTDCLLSSKFGILSGDEVTCLSREHRLGVGRGKMETE